MPPTDDEIAPLAVGRPVPPANTALLRCANLREVLNEPQSRSPSMRGSSPPAATVSSRLAAFVRRRSVRSTCALGRDLEVGVERRALDVAAGAGTERAKVAVDPHRIALAIVRRNAGDRAALEC